MVKVAKSLTGVIKDPDVSRAKQKQMEKSDFEVLFKNSPDYFVVQNAKLIFEESAARFICFDGDVFKEDVWFPYVNVHRIKRYSK